jgi:hypothetical protein
MSQMLSKLVIFSPYCKSPSRTSNHVLLRWLVTLVAVAVAVVGMVDEVDIAVAVAAALLLRILLLWVAPDGKRRGHEQIFKEDHSNGEVLTRVAWGAFFLAPALHCID